MKLLRGSSRKAIAAATSAGSPMRLSACSAVEALSAASLPAGRRYGKTAAAQRWTGQSAPGPVASGQQGLGCVRRRVWGEACPHGASPVIFAVIGVRVSPGATQFTRMFFGAYLWAGVAHRGAHRVAHRVAHVVLWAQAGRDAAEQQAGGAELATAGGQLQPGQTGAGSAGARHEGGVSRCRRAQRHGRDPALRQGQVRRRLLQADVCGPPSAQYTHRYIQACMHAGARSRIGRPVQGLAARGWQDVGRRGPAAPEVQVAHRRGQKPQQPGASSPAGTLAAAMASWLGMPCLATAEEQKTTLPPGPFSRRIMTLAAARSTPKEDSRLMRSVSSNSWGLVACAAARGEGAVGRVRRQACWAHARSACEESLLPARSSAGPRARAMCGAQSYRPCAYYSHPSDCMEAPKQAGPTVFQAQLEVEQRPRIT